MGGTPPQHLPLAPPHRLQRPPIRLPSARLHLHKKNHPPMTRHHIQLPMPTRAHIPPKNPTPPRPQQPRRPPFPPRPRGLRPTGTPTIRQPPKGQPQPNKNRVIPAHHALILAQPTPKRDPHKETRSTPTWDAPHLPLGCTTSPPPIRSLPKQRPARGVSVLFFF